MIDPINQAITELQSLRESLCNTRYNNKMPALTTAIQVMHDYNEITKMRPVLIKTKDGTKPINGVELELSCPACQHKFTRDTKFYHPLIEQDVLCQYCPKCGAHLLWPI